MRNCYIYLLPLLLVLSASCERYIEVELPAHVPRFIINAQLEPGMPIMVFVTQSRGILQESNFSPVRDATVEIIEDGEISYFLEFRGVEQAYWTVNGYVSDELEIQPGKTYEVIVSGRMETARSKVTIPHPVEIKSVEIQHTAGNMAEISVLFDDPQERNFYEFSVTYSGFRVFEGWSGTTDTIPINGEVSLTPLNPAYQTDYWSRGKVLLDDALFNGREAKLQFSGAFNTRAELDVKVMMRNVTEDYYRYNTTLNLQQQVSGDPLAQPVQVFSNIENGRGIFMASTLSLYTKKFHIILD